MKKQHKSIQLFKNPVLEALTHVHPALPFIIWIPATLYFYYLSFSAGIEAGRAVLLAVLAMIFWTITEYSLHRFVFHFPGKSRVSRYLVFLFHGIHHDDPVDPTRLVMPPVVSVTLSIPFYLLFKALLPLPAEYNLFFAVFMTGYMIYDYIHYATHHIRPRTAVGRYLKEFHMKHHFVDKEAKWGVSNPFWDYVLGTVTMPKPKKKQEAI